MKKRFHKLNLDIEKRIVYDQPHRKSFFQKDFVQMKWNKSKLSRNILEFNIVQIVTLINRKQEAKQKTILIHENVLAKVCKNGDHAWIDYENSIYEPISHLQYGDGIKLTKCFDSIEFYGEIERISQIVKRFTIQLDYSQYFVNVKKLSNCDKTEVFRIKSKQDRNDYQCRIINKKSLSTNMELQIAKEHHILRRMQDECIQKYYGTFETQDQILIIEELLIGGNLDGYLHRWSLFSEEKACKFFFKLFKTLAYLHSKGIMHRDLKPENIGLRLNGNLESPCITSFGLADIVENTEEQEEEDLYNQHHHLYERCGTPGYVAPEILENKKYDCKVDVYSMGIIFYQTLTGRKPFDNENYQQMLEDNQDGIVDTSILKLSKEGMIFAESILQPDPEERITAQLAINHIWLRNEKLNQLNDVKAHNKMRKIKLKRANYRISVQQQPNFLPTVTKSEIFSNTQSPIFGTSTQRGSVNNTSTFRISTLSSSFSPKDLQERKSGFYSTFNHKMKLNELSPLYPQQEYHNGIYFCKFRK